MKCRERVLAELLIKSRSRYKIELRLIELHNIDVGIRVQGNSITKIILELRGESQSS